MNATDSLDLPLVGAVAPEADPALRAVWQSLYRPLWPRITFEQAMQIWWMRMGVENSAYYRRQQMAKRHSGTRKAGK